jgi:hypothetical protein
VDDAVGEQGLEIALGDALDIGIEILVGGDGQVPAKIGDRLDGSEMVAPTEICVRLPGQKAAQQFFLHLLRRVRGQLEGGQPPPHRTGGDATQNFADQPVQH